MTATTKFTALRSQQLVERIRPLLAGQEPGIVGAALADLTAMFLAAHICTDANQQNDMRDELIKLQFNLILKLIPVNEAIIMERLNDEALKNISGSV